MCGSWQTTGATRDAGDALYEQCSRCRTKVNRGYALMLTRAQRATDERRYAAEPRGAGPGQVGQLACTGRLIRRPASRRTPSAL